jgi:hypothetical protein
MRLAARAAVSVALVLGAAWLEGGGGLARRLAARIIARGVCLAAGREPEEIL